MHIKKNLGNEKIKFENIQIHEKFYDFKFLFFLFNRLVNEDNFLKYSICRRTILVYYRGRYKYIKLTMYFEVHIYWFGMYCLRYLIKKFKVNYRSGHKYN